MAGHETSRLLSLEVTSSVSLLVVACFSASVLVGEHRHKVLGTARLCVGDCPGVCSRGRYRVFSQWYGIECQAVG